MVPVFRLQAVKCENETVPHWQRYKFVLKIVVMSLVHVCVGGRGAPPPKHSQVWSQYSKAMQIFADFLR